MRAATILAWGQIDWWPENLFRGCCPCICLTLKLLSQLWLVVRDCVFISFPSLKRESKRRDGALVCDDRHIYVFPRHVCSYQSAHRRVFVWVSDGERGRGERDGEVLCANPYWLWRIQGHPFMFCQPSVNHFPIKALLNSAVIPISSSRFHLTVLEALKHFFLVFSAATCLTGQSCPVKLSDSS